MTKRRPRYDCKTFTPEILSVYKRARKLYDQAESWPALRRTEFPALQQKLNELLDRTAPWLHEIFDTVDDDEPADWMNAERARNWHDAKAVMNALEEAA